MELNKSYSVNIICQLKTGSFIVVPKSNELKSEQYLNYRNNLLIFKNCSETKEWFESLDYPHIEIGKAVLVKVNKITNEWARGIVSKYNSNTSSPEIYLIDTQTFTDRKEQYEFRICPSKYLQLKLPTFSICIDVCFKMNDVSLKNATEIMIDKNQHGELNITFTPQSMQNNVYVGSLTVNNLPLKKYLQIALKQFSTKKEHRSSLFNPLHFCHLKNIFIPRHSSNLAFLDESLVSSISDLSSLNDSHENSSSNFLTDTIDYSENFSNDSSHKKIKSSKNSCIKSIIKQKVRSSKSPSSSRRKSTCSLYKDGNSPECLSENEPTDFTIQYGEKYQVPINPETTADNKDVLNHAIYYSEDLSDDSSLKTIESSKNSCIIPIAKQKVCSSKSSSLSRSNSSCSLDKDDNSPECLSENEPTDFTIQYGEKYQVPINPETTADNKDVLNHAIYYSEDLSDDSSHKTIESSKNSCIIPIAKQKVCSSKSSSLSRSNSSCSLDKEDNSSECLSEYGLTDFTIQNSKKRQVPINPETTADYKDENKSNVENTISTEIENQDINKEKPFIYLLMKKRSQAFRKTTAECQQNNNITKISNVLEKPKTSLLDDSNLWWSSDDES